MVWRKTMRGLVFEHHRLRRFGLKTQVGRIWKIEPGVTIFDDAEMRAGAAGALVLPVVIDGNLDGIKHGRSISPSQQIDTARLHAYFAAFNVLFDYPFHNPGAGFGKSAAATAVYLSGYKNVQHTFQIF